MLGLKEDLIHALRQLARHRGHAAVVVLVLALGFGANTAVFSVVDAVLFRPLPVQDPSAWSSSSGRPGPTPPSGT